MRCVLIIIGAQWLYKTTFGPLIEIVELRISDLSYKSNWFDVWNLRILCVQLLQLWHFKSVRDVNIHITSPDIRLTPNDENEICCWSRKTQRPDVVGWDQGGAGGGSRGVQGWRPRPRLGRPWTGTLPYFYEGSHSATSSGRNICIETSDWSVNVREPWVTWSPGCWMDTPRVGQWRCWSCPCRSPGSS